MVKRIDLAQENREFARGLERWRGFAEACLEHKGPAGVIHRGWSSEEVKRRATAEPWTAGWTSNPMDVVAVLGLARLVVATNHLGGLVSLVESGYSSPLAAVLRACAETSARAFWVLDPGLSPREAIARALTEKVYEISKYGPESKARFAKPQLDKVIALADKMGLPTRKNNAGELTRVGERRLNTTELLERMDTRNGVRPFDEICGHFRRMGNAATHGDTLAWVEALAMSGDESMRAMMMRSTSTHLMYAWELHVRALDAYNRAMAWTPSDLFEESRKAALAGMMIAYYPIVLCDRNGPSKQEGLDASEG